MKLDDFKPGDRVRYVPLYEGAWQDGTVTRVSDRYVFVRFGISTYGIACHPDRLRKV